MYVLHVHNYTCVHSVLSVTHMCKYMYVHTQTPTIMRKLCWVDCSLWYLLAYKEAIYPHALFSTSCVFQQYCLSSFPNLYTNTYVSLRMYTYNAYAVCQTFSRKFLGIRIYMCSSPRRHYGKKVTGVPITLVCMRETICSGVTQG